MNILLVQLDGSLPNLALMRLGAHHNAQGDTVTLRRAMNPAALNRGLFDDEPDRVYGSLIFERTRPLARRLLAIYPDATLGGTGWDLSTTLDGLGVAATIEPDYSLYPDYPHSIGFTQRGCRLKCPFCVVPKKEGAVREESSVWQIWRGAPHPRNLVLLDNDFFGQPAWRQRVDAMIEGRFKVCFNQGINARMLTDETARAIASVRYYDDQFKTRRIYTAWDNLRDESRLMKGLEALTRYGVKPDQIMVYVLIGYWPGESVDSWEHRRATLRQFGARPYPMPFERTREAVGFRRWCIGGYDKRVPWDAWVSAKYQPANLGYGTDVGLFAEAPK
jgi:hypothetical protein